MQISQDSNHEVESGDSHHGVVSNSLTSIYRDKRPTFTEIDPSEAQLLLTHFKDYIISQLQIMLIEKESPWETNNLNAATMTLRRLTYITSQPDHTLPQPICRH
ncbi:uncharacterized protein A1O5_05766 [Cladophialophora psammophila CBS 110553]|uniref:Uncharacterized protein n=1 Tax=Cladophialophora psammophila CBS 110553 TaxID=1182543 RepID=W9X1G9_9EURO|nr:uncharacterized protein A1O5_05766 [Cladophialophora psammophila CBS 110553]EXJ70776.1 hypothetical protein A1O5_05766 [Cladophialophora psammophila CBS 110553]